MKPTWTSDCGSVQLYLGDCLEVLPTLEAVDAVVTDPPYGVDGSSGTINKARGKSNYSANFEDTEESVLRDFVPAIHRCIAMASVVVMTPGPHAWHYPKPSAIGMIDQPASVGLCRWGAVTCQPVLFYGRDPRLGKSIQRLSFRTNGVIANVDHPCPKPLDVVAWMVDRASLDDQTILDPFMGSGTTGVAALRLGRKFIGIELDPNYFETAKRRIEDELNRYPLLEPEPPKQTEMFTEAIR